MRNARWTHRRGDDREASGAAAVVRRASAGVSLADVLLFTFVLTGAEAVQFRTSVERAAHYAPFQIAFSHSLATAAIAGTATAAFYAWRRRHVWGAAVLVVAMIVGWGYWMNRARLVTAPTE